MITSCEYCKKKIFLSRAKTGDIVKCPHCKGVFKMPEMSGSGVEDSLKSDLHVEIEESSRGRTINRITVINLSGEIDTPSVPVLKGFLDEQLQKKNTDIILNMSGVRYINSVGMGLLLRMKNDFKQKFGDIKICCLRDNVKRLMQVIGLLKIFEVYADVETARRAFSGLFDDVKPDNTPLDKPVKERDILIKCLVCGKVSEMSQHEKCKTYLQLTRNYVWDHNNASIQEVSQATGVPENYIRTFVSNNWFVTTGGFYTEAGNKSS